jgi:hypothetical protein
MLGYLESMGLYVVVPVDDKFNKTRYLLNFAGIRSSAYYIGIFMADYVIYSISSFLLFGFVFVLDLGVFTENAGNLLLILAASGLPYITMAYLFGFIFDNSETAFKWVFWLSLFTYAIPQILMGDYMPVDVVSILKIVFKASSPLLCFSYALSEIGKPDQSTSVFSRISIYLCF